MNDLEAETRALLTPLITGRFAPIHTLSPADQDQIARWIYKTVMVFDLISPWKGAPFFADVERSHFRTSGRLPTDGHPMIWLGRYEGATAAAAVDYRVFAHPQNDVLRTAVNGYLSTICVGQLAFQLLTFRTDVNHRPINARLFASDWKDMNIQAWPLTNAPTAWPPPRSMDDRLFSLFIDRWRPKATS
jgi:hypothetical protein